jgi:hypothetical protein
LQELQRENHQDAHLVSPPCSPTYDAALAAHLAALLAYSMKLNYFIIEGVSHVIMDALMSPAPNTKLLFIKLFKKPLLVSLPPPYGGLNIFPEVKTYAPSMWHIRP